MPECQAVGWISLICSAVMVSAILSALFLRTKTRSFRWTIAATGDRYHQYVDEKSGDVLAMVYHVYGDHGDLAIQCGGMTVSAPDLATAKTFVELLVNANANRVAMASVPARHPGGHRGPGMDQATGRGEPPVAAFQTRGFVFDFD